MEKTKNILEAIKAQGGRGYLVGGAVRDMMLGIPLEESKDVDVEVHGLDESKLMNVLMSFGDVKACGKSYGVFKLDKYDFSLPRSEKKSGERHKDFDVTCDPFMGVIKACQRRDFTVNAVMFDPLNGQVIDPYDGRADLANGILRHVNDVTFGEDALRVMRCAQFMARFGFTVAVETEAICKSLVKDMDTLSRERYYEEFKKMLLRAEKPSTGIRFLARVGVLQRHFPELFALIGIDQGSLHHAEGDAFEHTMLALDSVPVGKRTLEVMLAVLTHDFGKAVVKAERDGDAVHFFGHAEEGEARVRSFLDRLTNDVELVEGVVSLVVNHMRPYDLKQNMKRNLVRKLALKVDLMKLMTLHRADKLGRLDVADLSYVEEIEAMYADIMAEVKPLVLGRHLIENGLTPSPQFGKVLKATFDAQVEGLFSTVEDGVIFALKVAKA